MRFAIEEHRAVRAPAVAAWAAMEDLPSWPVWDPYIMAIEPLDDAPAAAAAWRPGRRWREHVRRGGFAAVFHLTVTACDPGHRIEWATRYLRVHAIHVWTIDADPAGCRVTSVEAFAGPAPLVATARWLLFPLFRVRGMTRRSLDALAERVEAMAADAPVR